MGGLVGAGRAEGSLRIGMRMGALSGVPAGIPSASLLFAGCKGYGEGKIRWGLDRASEALKIPVIISFAIGGLP